MNIVLSHGAIYSPKRILQAHSAGKCRRENLVPRAAAAPPLQAPGTQPVSAHLGNLVEAGAQTSQQMAVKAGGGWRQGVVAPQAPLADRHELGLAKVSQVAGGGRLRDADDLYQIADAQLSGLEQAQDAEPGGVGEGTELGVGSVLRRRTPGCVGRRHKRQPVWAAAQYTGWRGLFKEA
jgi:hypothetical protein